MTYENDLSIQEVNEEIKTGKVGRYIVINKIKTFDFNAVILIRNEQWATPGRCWKNIFVKEFYKMMMMMMMMIKLMMIITEYSLAMLYSSIYIKSFSR